MSFAQFEFDRYEQFGGNRRAVFYFRTEFPLHDGFPGGTVQLTRSAALFNPDPVRMPFGIKLDVQGDVAAVIVAKRRCWIFRCDTLQNCGIMIALR